MHMKMDMLQVLSVVTPAITFVLIVSGLLFVVQMYKKKQTEGVPFLQFVFTAANCSLFVYYGFLKEDAMIFRINAIGLSLNLFYISTYLLYVRNKGLALTQAGGTAVVCLLYMHYLRDHLVDEGSRADSLGLVAAITSTLMVVSPIQVVFDARSVKDGSVISLPFTVLGLLCGVSWLMYGYLVGDVYVYAPNLPGIGVSLLCLYTALTL